MKNEGIKTKYIITKKSGKPIPDGTFMFVLRPDTDPAAVRALEAYADATPSKQLAKELYEIVDGYSKSPLSRDDLARIKDLSKADQSRYNRGFLAGERGQPPAESWGAYRRGYEHGRHKDPYEPHWSDEKE